MGRTTTIEFWRGDKNQYHFYRKTTAAGVATTLMNGSIINESMFNEARTNKNWGK